MENPYNKIFPIGQRFKISLRFLAIRVHEYPTPGVHVPYSNPNPYTYGIQDQVLHGLHEDTTKDILHA